MFAGSNYYVQLLSFGVAILCGAPAIASKPFAPSVEFNRDIRPILSDNCFHCHGPDRAQRQAGLRLDTSDGAQAMLESGNRAIVPGDISESELIRRITADDDGILMPPADSDRKLNPTQIELLKNWIEAGARWQKHWSLLPPTKPETTPIRQRDWPRVAWDAFVLSRLEREGLKPSPEADKITLLRRVTLDLTGLPPTIDEIDEFIRDNSPNAYEKVVDRLLNSPRFGERMATDWLDAARYADTNGYQTDGVRYMWRWRDWVINALNSNMPFDQFTIEQLAGDMLPNATLDQKIATGFNRNHRGNAEGGIIPQEYAVEYVVDRVDTTATVWLGLTAGCARCHDHKFDPITQKEYYQLFALFNNVPERGRAIKIGNSDPQIKSPTSAQQAELARLDQQLAEAKSRFAEVENKRAAAQAQWETAPRTKLLEDWWPSRGLTSHIPLDGNAADRCGVSDRTQGGTADVTYAGGQVCQAATFSGAQSVDIGEVGNFGYFDRFSIAIWARPQKPNGVILGRMSEAADASGYTLQLDRGKLQLNLVVRWLDDALRVETTEPLQLNRWQHVVTTYDGSRMADGVRIYIDGKPAPIRVIIDELNQSFAVKQPLLLAAGGPGPRFVGSLDELRIYNRVLSGHEAEILATLENINEIAAMPPDARTAPQESKLRECFRDQYLPASFAELRSNILRLEHERQKLEDSIPTTMVMRELPEPRETFLLSRGEYDKPAEKVSPGVPAALSWPGQPPVRNRLEFARWLVAPQNPLMARATVNRIWQLYFGRGLVKSTNDLGSQGDRPSHPELLDYLATELVSNGWNLKALHKSIVTSATYRQSSRSDEVLAHLDPDNCLLTRGPRIRLSAEMIRDQALFTSGLLVEQIGGPSVLPYQPEGLWKELGDAEFTQDHGDALYRRSLYTFWKRTVAPPTMVAFDAAGRESCRVLQTRTNTPLQALALLNEVTFVEAARELAERTLIAAGEGQAERIEYMFRLVLSRSPTAAELSVFAAGLGRHLDHYRRQPQAAAKLLGVGEAPRSDKLNTVELAAYATIANLILNLDETVTKQ